MTLTLEIAPEVERALSEAAAANGQSLPDFAARQLAAVARTVKATPQRPTAASVRGKYALPGVNTVDEFLAERHAEAMADEAAYQAQQATPSAAQRRAA